MSKNQSAPTAKEEASLAKDIQRRALASERRHHSAIIIPSKQRMECTNRLPAHLLHMGARVTPHLDPASITRMFTIGMSKGALVVEMNRNTCESSQILVQLPTHLLLMVSHIGTNVRPCHIKIPRGPNMHRLCHQWGPITFARTKGYYLLRESCSRSRKPLHKPQPHHTITTTAESRSWHCNKINPSSNTKAVLRSQTC